MRRILVVAAHPDDEWYGLGGTLIKHKKMHYEINILIVTDGERGDNRGPDRIKSSENLCDIEFRTHLKTFGLPANKVHEHVPEAVAMLDVLLHQLQPDIIFTHYFKDTHQDHGAVFKIVRSSSRKAPDSSVWLFQSPSSRPFVPNMIVNIEDEFLDKVMTYQKYFEKEIENRKRFSVNHMERFNSYWGTKIMKNYAEAFRIYRGVLI